MQLLRIGDVAAPTTAHSVSKISTMESPKVTGEDLETLKIRKNEE